MSTFSKKFVSAALTTTTAVWMSGAMLLVPVAHAQTDLQAQIAALLQQIQTLQAQLNAKSGTTVSTTFTRNLTVGSRGTDVKALQQWLNSKGATVAVSGAGSAGMETEYFGPATKAALAKWQAANGISPAAGYFGPITRAKIAAMSGSTGGSTGGGVVTPIPGSGLSVSLSSSNPAAGSLISSSGSAASRVPVLAIDLTAGSASGITVSTLKFKKMGVLSDSSISGAYITENGKVISQYQSITNGVVTFSNMALSIAAGQKKTLVLEIDPATGLSAGNTVSFAFAGASDVTATDAANATVTASGVFPANGNLFTVTSVSNPSLATLTVASSSIGTSVTAGTTNNIVGAWSFTGANSKLWLKGINFKVIGSANRSDIANVKLFVNGTQVGPTLASVAADGTAYFDLSSSPATLNTGANSVQVKADIMGSPNYNFQFEILNSYDITAVDSQYNVPVTAASNVGTQVSILAGTITLQAASDTPTGSLSAGQSNVTLSKFTFYAAGESVKVKWLGFGLNFTSASGTIDQQVKNVALTDDAGGQVGSTINTLSTSQTCTDTAYSNSTTSFRGCFGSSGSAINYIVPANTTRVLSLKGDLQSTASFTNITATITANTSNLQGLTSSATASTGAATGSTRALASSALTVAKNTGVGTQTLTANAQNKRIGSYNLTASSAEGVSISTITITSGAAGAQFQNLMVKVDGVQFGDTKGVLANSTAYSFSGSAFTVPAGQTKVVEVYANVLSSASVGTKTAITVLSSCSANGAISLASITCTSTNGQDVFIAGQATLTVTAPSGQASDQIVAGSKDNVLGTFTFAETTNIEDLKVTDLYVYDRDIATATVKSAFENVRVYKADGTLLGTAGSATTGVHGYYYKFNFATPLTVPMGNSVNVILKGDVTPYSASAVTDNTSHIFKIVASSDTDLDTAAEVAVTYGLTSNATSTVTLTSATGPTKTVQRTKLSFSDTPLGTTTGRAKSSADNLATLSFTADAAGEVKINSVIITFSGTAPSIATFLDGVTLVDNATGGVLGTVNTTSTTACNGTNTCTKTFNLGSTTSGYTVDAGSTKTWTLRIDGTKTQTTGSGVSGTLTATVNALTDIRYTIGNSTDNSTTLSLPSNVVVPIELNSISFTSGT